jgi:hypothetical protein
MIKIDISDNEDGKSDAKYIEYYSECIFWSIYNTNET